ncbi:cupin domain-containing protein [bacterium]|nr:cupin domain-containing protein [bacterium]
MNKPEEIKIIKPDALDFKPTKRDGVIAARMIGPEDSATQNVVIVELAENAVVEEHETETAESIYVLQGMIDLKYDGNSELLIPGDLAYFPRGTSHELVPRRTPCRLMLIYSW